VLMLQKGRGTKQCCCADAPKEKKKIGEVRCSTSRGGESGEVEGSSSHVWFWCTAGHFSLQKRRKGKSSSHISKERVVSVFCEGKSPLTSLHKVRGSGSGGERSNPCITNVFGGCDGRE
jgi:hypothetical protein